MMKKVILLLAFAAMTASTGAQKVAVKNNVVYDVLATPNLGVELGLGRATTLDISGNYNPFQKNDGTMFQHWLVQPEFRYWLCERALFRRTPARRRVQYFEGETAVRPGPGR